MATLKEYFDKDFSHVLSAHRVRRFRVESLGGDLEIIERLHFDFNSYSKYISYYIPETIDVFGLCKQLIENPGWALSLCDTVHVEQSYVGEDCFMGSITDLVFTGRIFVYSEVGLSDKDRELLHNRANELGRALIFRGPKYVKEKSQLEKPLAFICHDTRDKDEVARPLAIELSKMMCPVWFDEFSLKVGDSLRESIEKGIRECRKCIMVLSPHFFSNGGWTKAEFDSIYIREVIEKQNVMLPVWYDVTLAEVYDYSPRLADRVGVPFTLGVAQVAKKIYKAIIT